jgi:Histidine kinase-, DNA gyrase B-, and HSP90-like ATPase
MTVYDTTPTARVLLAERNREWTVFGALAEVIDNSFGGNTGNADTVVITHNKRTLTVMDNGRGLEHLHFVFQLGGGSGDRAGDIGRYGVGGTEAGLYLADRVDVWTMRDGKSCHHSVDWVHQIEVGQYPKITESWKVASAANTPSELFELGHGTIIRFHLQKGRIVRPPQVRQRLAETFGPGLRNGKVIIWRTPGEGEDRLMDPVPTLSDVKPFALAIEYHGEMLPVIWGSVGYNESLSYKNSTVAIGFGSRVISRTRDCYKKMTGTGITGWLDLGEGFQKQLTAHKDGFRDNELWEAVMNAVHEEIKPILERIENQKKSAPSLPIFSSS